MGEAWAPSSQLGNGLEQHPWFPNLRNFALAWVFQDVGAGEEVNRPCHALHWAFLVVCSLGGCDLSATMHMFAYVIRSMSVITNAITPLSGDPSAYSMLYVGVFGFYIGVYARATYTCALPDSSIILILKSLLGCEPPTWW